MTPESLTFDVAPGSFEKQVLERSFEKPVVVDFWAEWCAPCRTLGPVLEKVVDSYGGRALLAKVNVDQDRETAVRYRVQGIPAVKVFRDGKVVAEFVGALPEEQVRRTIDAVVPSQADELVEKGDRLADEGNAAKAEAAYRKAIEERPDHTGALLGLGRLELEKGNVEEARDLLGRIEEHAEEHSLAQALLAGMEFAEVCAANGGRAECAKELDAGPESLEARYNHGCCLAAEGEYEDALAEFLEVVARDRNWRDQAARDAMVRIFELVGPRSDLANEYRRKLAGVLY